MLQEKQYIGKRTKTMMMKMEKVLLAMAIILDLVHTGTRKQKEAVLSVKSAVVPEGFLQW
jgi:hypothetical protein